MNFVQKEMKGPSALDILQRCLKVVKEAEELHVLQVQEAQAAYKVSTSHKNDTNTWTHANLSMYIYIYHI